jgi:hypothetical protein
MVDQQYTDFNHPDLQMPRIRSDDVDVRSFGDKLVESLQRGQLFSLSTATAVPSEVAKDLPT